MHQLGIQTISIAQTSNRLPLLTLFKLGLVVTRFIPSTIEIIPEFWIGQNDIFFFQKKCCRIEMVHNETRVKQITRETQKVNYQAENEDESIADA